MGSPSSPLAGSPPLTAAPDGASPRALRPETKARELDEAARSLRLRSMLSSYFDGVWRFLRRMGLSAEDADDSAQEVMLVATRRIEDIEDDKQQSFLFGTAYRVAVRLRQKNAAQKPEEKEDAIDELHDERPGPEAELEQRQAQALLDQILGSMPEDLRAVFVCFELEDMTMAEIATSLGLPPGTVASRLRRAREDFTAKLNRHRARTSLRGLP